VERTGRQWQLTESGQSEATAAAAKLKDDAEDVVELAGRRFRALSQMGAMDSVVSNLSDVLGFSAPLESLFDRFTAMDMMEESLARLTSELPTFDALSVVNHLNVPGSAAMEAVGDLFPDFTPLMSAAGSMSTLSETMVTSAIHESAAALLGISHFNLASTAETVLATQVDYASLLSRLHTSDSLLSYDVIGQQTEMLAETAGHLLAIDHTNFAELASVGSLALDLSWAPGQLESVVDSFSDLFHYQVEGYQVSEELLPVSTISAYLTASTLPVNRYSGAVRYLIEAETDDEVASQSAKVEVGNGDDSLDPLLADLNPDFVEIRHGSWHPLRSGGPDRHRHAGVSQRELLTQVLRHFVPGSELPVDDRGGPQIKARVKAILDSSDPGKDAAFIEAMAMALYRGYDELNNYTHRNEKHDASIRYLLQAGEGLLGFLLVNVRNNDPYS
jgi:hypothetical protein